MQNSHLECIKTGTNDDKFSIIKYHIIKMEIIRLFRVNKFMSVTKFPRLTVLLFCKTRSFDQFRGLFRETNDKNLGVYVGKERERKYANVKGSKILPSSSIDTKKVTKKRES